MSCRPRHHINPRTGRKRCLTSLHSTGSRDKRWHFFIPHSCHRHISSTSSSQFICTALPSLHIRKVIFPTGMSYYRIATLTLILAPIAPASRTGKHYRPFYIKLMSSVHHFCSAYTSHSVQANTKKLTDVLWCDFFTNRTAQFLLISLINQFKSFYNTIVNVI